MPLRKCMVWIFFLGLLGGSPATGEARDDWELWLPVSFTYKINDKLAFKVAPTVRFMDDFQHHYYWETFQGFAYKLNKHVDLGLYHFYAEKERSGRSDSKENRLRTDVTLRTTLGELGLSTRSRYEWRDVDGDPKSRYRNRLQVERPVTIFEQEFVPFVSNEFFYNIRTETYDENRGIIGVSKKINKHLKTSLFYMIKSNRTGSDWNETHVIGTQFDITLN